MLVARAPRSLISSAVLTIIRSRAPGSDFATVMEYAISHNWLSKPLAGVTEVERHDCRCVAIAALASGPAES